MKKERLEKILELIAIHEIDTQEALGEELLSCGFMVTQPTVSRDIRELELIKILGTNGVYKYAPPIKRKTSEVFGGAIFSSISSVDYAGNMVVLKCGAGMAQAVCTSIDGMNFPEIVGTLAGDDTVFILARSEDGAAGLAKQLSK